MPHRSFYRRHLPHFQPAGATFHVIVRLAGSLPRSVIDALRAEQAGLRRADQPDDAELRAAQESQDRLHFRRIEQALDGAARDHATSVTRSLLLSSKKRSTTGTELSTT